MFVFVLLTQHAAAAPHPPQFSNLLGAVYRQGNLNFSSDGNSVISPVGNRVSVFDLKKSVKKIICLGFSLSGAQLEPSVC